MSEISGGEVLARCLAQEGVTHVFGLPSPEIDPFLAAMEGHGIRLVPVRHEAAGAHMAEGLYKSSGKVSAVIGNPGPGSANLLAGVITARHEGVPMLAITSQHQLGLVYPSSPATFQGQDQLDVYKPAVKWGGPVFSWQRIPEVVRMAFREMFTGRPGPVQIELPAPVLYEMGEESSVSVLEPQRYRAGYPQASSQQIEQAASLLAGAKRPVVVAGGGVNSAGASASLLSIVELLDCPVVASMAGRSAIPTDHPNRIYGIGGGGDVVKREADVVLVAGSRMGNLDLPFDKYWGDGSSQKLIQIDIDPRNMGVSRPMSLAIVAELATALEGIGEELKRHVRAGAGRSSDMQRYREVESAWWSEQFRAVYDWEGEGMHPAHVMRGVGEKFGREAVYVSDGGNTSLWASWFLPPTKPASYLSIFELGMLGTGIPAAIGAKLANPGRDVVCVTGDGAAGFHFMEMQSAAREGLDITVVVFSEGRWTMEEPNELMLYGRTFGTEMGEIRWDIVGQGLGCKGLYVEKLEELAGALDEARSFSGPAVICVRTDVSANFGIPQDPLLRFTEVYQGPG